MAIHKIGDLYIPHKINRNAYTRES